MGKRSRRKADGPGKPTLPLVEQYRPKRWEDIIGQDKVVKQVMTVAKRGLGGWGYWISGVSGTGKTTIARLIAQELADPFFVEETDARELTLPKIRGQDSRSMASFLTRPTV